MNKTKLFLFILILITLANVIFFGWQMQKKVKDNFSKELNDQYVKGVNFGKDVTIQQIINQVEQNKEVRIFI